MVVGRKQSVVRKGGGPADASPCLWTLPSSLLPTRGALGLGATWGSAPYPVVVADPSGTVIDLNVAAAALFPGAVTGAPLRDVVPEWLADAQTRLRTDIPGPRRTGPAPAASGGVGDRTFEAHPTCTEDGDVMWWLVDDTDRRLAEDALRSERERTAFLAGASSALLSSLNVERCMEVTARLAAEHLADAAVIVAPSRGRKVPLTFCGPDGAVEHRTVQEDLGQLPGLSDALRGFPPVPSRWIDPAGVPGWIVPDSFTEPVGSAVVTPLPGHGAPAGALILLRSSHHAAFTESEEIFARLFAARAGAAMSAARMYAEQAAITTTLMRELLPPQLHGVHGVQFAGTYRPAGQTERVGGDFYDVHPGTDEGQESLVVLGDVCGKGLEAAVLTGKIRNTVQALLPLAADHQRLLGLLNGALMNSHHTRFATLAIASVVRRGGTVHLRVTSAGHPPPLIVRADGLVEQARTRGHWLARSGRSAPPRPTSNWRPARPACSSRTASPRRGEDRWETNSSASSAWRTCSPSARACRPRPWSNTSSCSPRSGSAAGSTTTWRPSRSPPPTTRT